ncbi:hypothetical protein, partial [Ilumatobacter sp.]|uniref:hypothetical protein n=1 Tax=Ilumatobacter sp. TaxID=1967498 RepID=UPI003AF8BAA7
MKPAALGALLTWFVVTGCTGERDRSDDGLGAQPPGTADALVELPPAPLLTTGPAAAPGTPGGQMLGAWNWAAPCRVVAHEVVGTGGLQVMRTFTVVVSPDPVGGGFTMSFEDVTEQTDGLTEADVADLLYRNLAVL